MDFHSKSKQYGRFFYCKMRCYNILCAFLDVTIHEENTKNEIVGMRACTSYALSKDLSMVPT